MSDAICKNCRFFEEIDEENGSPILPESGHCARWHEGYDLPNEITSRTVWIENDEGWGNIVGPEFGCVLFEGADR